MNAVHLVHNATLLITVDCRHR